MPPETSREIDLYEDLLSFFKALADENRLKIVGLLARQSYSVGQIAAILGIEVATASHHLARLSKAGLVSSRTDGHYCIYSLEMSNLQNLSRRMLNIQDLQGLSKDVELDAYDKKVLASFTNPAGRITAFPAQEKKFLVLLRYVLKAFEPGLRYPEKQVNDILSKFNDDTALLRRSLIEYRFMHREGGGGPYWVNVQEEE